ncbi:hypothetical protein D3C72_2378770 [compost metagenome]
MPDSVVRGKADIGLAVDVGGHDLLFRSEAMVARRNADEVSAAQGNALDIGVVRIAIDEADIDLLG